MSSIVSELSPSWPPFYGELHRKYVRELGTKTDSYEYQVTEHLRLSGVYWGFTAMSLLRAQDEKMPLLESMQQRTSEMAALQAVRGVNSIYHNNAIQTWRINPTGEVENVRLA